MLFQDIINIGDNMKNILDKHEETLRRLIGLVIFVVAVIVTVKIVTFNNSDYHKLTKLGYTKEQAKEIVNMDKGKKVLNYEYNEAMLDILKGKYYLDKNLMYYIDYYNEHKDLSINDIIAIVNVHRNSEFYSLDLETDTSKGYSMLVNKYYGLSKDYKPENLYKIKNWYSYGDQTIDEEVYDQFIAMYNAAKKEDLSLIINDSYRSYEDQDETYKRYGDDYAARPGHSEHNSGLAIDIISPTSSGATFETTKEFEWLSKHAHEYGFILRYPKGKENITGYEYESWHYRYLGTSLATKVYNEGITFDEYYAYYLDN